MHKLNFIILLVALLANVRLINCADNDSSTTSTTTSAPSDDTTTAAPINHDATFRISADRESYNPGQQVKVDVSFKDVVQEFTLELACRDAEKCEKVFNCTDCGSYTVPPKGSSKQFQLTTLSSGNVVLYLTNTTNETELYPDLSQSFLRISVGRSQILDYLSLACGWIYFFAWSISFYPQIILNIRRKSVVGLNFDFIALNVTGFFFYSVFNVAMRYDGSVRREYLEQNPFSLIPVETNDVVFAVHAFFVSVVTLIQCFCIYERQNQTISRPTTILLVVFWAIAIVFFVLVELTSISILFYLNLLSYIKLLISFIKYIPQAYYNYQRKSTVGWSIGNILFDLTGGFFSLLQICLINFNYDDWGNIKGNLTKFGLGLLSMLFDFLFITQHYVLYRDRSEREPVQNSETSSDSDVNKA